MNTVLYDSLLAYGPVDSMRLLSEVIGATYSISSRTMVRDRQEVLAWRSYDPDGAVLRIVTGWQTETEVTIRRSFQVNSIAEWIGIVEAMAWLVIGKEPTPDRLSGTYCWRHFMQTSRVPAWKAGAPRTASPISTLMDSYRGDFSVQAQENQQSAPDSAPEITYAAWTKIQQSALFDQRVAAPFRIFSITPWDEPDAATPQAGETQSDAVSPFLHGPRKIVL